MSTTNVSFARPPSICRVQRCGVGLTFKKRRTREGRTCVNESFDMLCC